jgi:hypothetical protein
MALLQADMDLLFRRTTRTKFALAMAVYSLLGAFLIYLLLIYLAGIESSGSPRNRLQANNRSLVFFSISAVLIAPVLESALLIAIIAIVSRIFASQFMRIVLPTFLLCLLHSLAWAPWGLVVAPVFLLSSYGYLRWKPEGFFGAVFTTVLIHALYNAPGAILLLFL